MVGRTHAAAGAALGAVAGSLAPTPAGPYFGAAVGALAALLPDVDHPGAKAGRWLRPVSVWLEWRFRHRESPTHTLLFALLAGLALGFLALPLAGPVAVLAGALGGTSHLALDALTRSGVAPFRPWSKRRFRGPLVTGSPAEWAVLAAALALLAVVAAHFRF